MATPVTAEDFHTAAVAFFLDSWQDNGVDLRTPVKLQNIDGLLTLVDGSTRVPEAPEGGAWVEFGVYEDAVGQIEFGQNGGNAKLVNGHLAVSIRVPDGTGATQAKTYGSQAVTALEKKTIGGVCTRAQDGPVMIYDEDVYLRYEVLVPYRRYELV